MLIPSLTSRHASVLQRLCGVILASLAATLSGAFIPSFRLALPEVTRGGRVKKGLLQLQLARETLPFLRVFARLIIRKPHQAKCET